MNRNTKRSTTLDEMANGLRFALRTLSRACSEFSSEAGAIEVSLESGPPRLDYGPIADIAAALRKLLAPTNGDNVLARVCSAAGIELPSTLAAPPASLPKPTWDKDILNHISTGAIPIAQSDIEARVSFAELWGLGCIALVDQDHPVPVTMTWGELVKDIADKMAVHLDPKRPTAWDLIDSYYIGTVPLIPFMLYRLALAVLAAGNEVLAAIGAEPVLVEAGESLGGMTCNAMRATNTTKRPGAVKPGRNDPCPCGTPGAKFKKCCGR